jgi:hypothetical protein
MLMDAWFVPSSILACNNVSTKKSWLAFAVSSTVLHLTMSAPAVRPLRSTAICTIDPAKTDKREDLSESTGGSSSSIMVILT